MEVWRRYERQHSRSPSDVTCRRISTSPSTPSGIRIPGRAPTDGSVFFRGSVRPEEARRGGGAGRVGGSLAPGGPWNREVAAPAGPIVARHRRSPPSGAIPFPPPRGGIRPPPPAAPFPPSHPAIPP